jgi:hypothetical protein
MLQTPVLKRAFDRTTAETRISQKWCQSYLQGLDKFTVFHSTRLTTILNTRLLQNVT